MGSFLQKTPPNTQVTVALVGLLIRQASLLCAGGGESNPKSTV